MNPAWPRKSASCAWQALWRFHIAFVCLLALWLGSNDGVAQELGKVDEVFLACEDPDTCYRTILEYVGNEELFVNPPQALVTLSRMRDSLSAWDKEDSSFAWKMTGVAFAVMGNHEESRQAFETAIASSRFEGDVKGEALGLFNLAIALSELERDAGAFRSFRDARLLERQLGDVLGEFHATLGMAKSLQRVQLTSEARELFYEAQEMLQSAQGAIKEDDAEWLEAFAELHYALGVVNYELGELDSARHYLLQEYEHRSRQGQTWYQCGTANDIGLAWKKGGNQAKARTWFHQARALADSCGNLQQKADAEYHLSAKQLRLNSEEGLAMAQSARSAYQLLEDGEGLKNVSERLGELFAELNLSDSSARYYGDFAALSSEMNLERQASRDSIKNEVFQYYSALNSEAARHARGRQSVLVWVVLMVLIVAFLMILTRWFGTAEEASYNQIKSMGIRHSEFVGSLEDAQRIQQSLLPSEAEMRAVSEHVAVLHLPRDLVSGDFYWVGKRGDEEIYVVADCTGHGIPGAMVAMASHQALIRAIDEHGTRDPGRILERTRLFFAKQFQRDAVSINDGMDVGVLVISHRGVQFAGANHDLLVVSPDSKEMRRIRGVRQAIGAGSSSMSFETVEVQCQESDMLYLCSDGMADQFGGPQGKKLLPKRMRSILSATSHMPLDVQRKAWHAKLMAWQGTEPQVDDITVLGVRSQHSFARVENS